MSRAGGFSKLTPPSPGGASPSAASAPTVDASLILVILGICFAVLLIICIIVCFCMYRQRKKREREEELLDQRESQSAVDRIDDRKSKDKRQPFWKRLGKKNSKKDSTSAPSLANMRGGITEDEDELSPSELKRRKKLYEMDKKRRLAAERKRRIAERHLPVWWQSPPLADSDDTDSDGRKGSKPSDAKRNSHLSVKRLGVQSPHSGFRTVGSLYPTPHALKKHHEEHEATRAEKEKEAHNRKKIEEKEKLKAQNKRRKTAKNIASGSGGCYIADTDGGDSGDRRAEYGIGPTGRRTRYSRNPYQPLHKEKVVAALPTRQAKFRIMEPPAEVGNAKQVIEQRLPMSSGRDFVGKHYSEMKHVSMLSHTNPLHQGTPLGKGHTKENLRRKEQDKKEMKQRRRDNGQDSNDTFDFDDDDDSYGSEDGAEFIGGFVRPSGQQATASLAMQAASVLPFDEHLLAKPVSDKVRKVVRGSLTTSKALRKEVFHVPVPDDNGDGGDANSSYGGSCSATALSSAASTASAAYVVLPPTLHVPIVQMNEMQRLPPVQTRGPTQPLFEPYYQDDDL